MTPEQCRNMRPGGSVRLPGPSLRFCGISRPQLRKKFRPGGAKSALLLSCALYAPPGQEDSKDSADLSVIAYIVAAMTGCGALVIARKK